MKCGGFFPRVLLLLLWKWRVGRLSCWVSLERVSWTSVGGKVSFAEQSCLWSRRETVSRCIRVIPLLGISQVQLDRWVVISEQGNVSSWKAYCDILPVKQLAFWNNTRTSKSHQWCDEHLGKVGRAGPVVLLFIKVTSIARQLFEKPSVPPIPWERAINWLLDNRSQSRLLSDSPIDFFFPFDLKSAHID